MKIAFVTGSLVHGGAERHAITLANRLAERGHECRFFYVKNDPSQLSRLRLPAACLHAQRYLDLAALRTLAASLSDIKPEVVFATNPYALMYATLARPPAPIAVTLHSTWTRTLKETLQMAAYRPLFWAAAQAIFVCERQRRHWKRRLVFARANRVIYNGVDLEHWNPRGTFGRDGVRRALGFAAGDYVIGMSAVLRPEKNPLQLVEALALLRRRGVPARALFIGDGEMRPALEARAARLGVAGDLVVTGLQQDVRPFLAACDVLAVPSFTEAFSLAAIEAMALGRPVIHAEVGGAAEMIAHGHNGYLFPVGDAPALAARLAAAAEPASRARLARNARETVEIRFAERSMVERYEQTLLELASTRSKRDNLRRRAAAH